VTQNPRARAKVDSRIYWFAALFWTICFEGLGRRYLPAIPSVAFYVLKDVVLIIGFFRFPPPANYQRTVKFLYSGFQVFWIATFVWTVIQFFNPDHASVTLGLLGLRAYWLWWMAPVLVAGVLQSPETKKRAIIMLSVTVIVISAFAAVQFVSPSTSAVNLYTVQNGKEIYADTAALATTGRARVSATFTFLSGFGAFTILIPTLLLSIGMGTDDKRSRKYALTAMAVSAAALPMTGSRGTFMMGVAVLGLTAWAAGLFFTKLGRRVIVGVCAGALLSTVAFPDAFLGLASRFENKDETSSRLTELLDFLPVVSLLNQDYPMGGIGTGMQQNARFQMGVDTVYNSEGENGRYLIELGPIGYLTYWAAGKVGLCVALLRAYRILKRANRRSAAAAALSYSFLAVIGDLTFDHVWQALFFVGCGFILSEVIAVQRQQAEARAAAAAAAAPPPPSGRSVAVQS
jgi:hypothetical protein